MASVVKETRNGRTLYRIQYRDGDKRRKSIRLGPVTRKSANHICAKVEALVDASISGRPLDADTARWVVKLKEDLAGKLANAGLIEHRVSTTLGGFIDGYIASRSDAEDNTIRNWQNSRRKLTDFFGEEIDLRKIRPGAADDWRQWLVDTPYADATVSKAVKHAKQFLKSAVRKRLADENPFIDLKAGGEENNERQVFVPHETFQKVLDACPDAEWRAIVALSRIGGLRCPSETLALEWQHIDWESSRFTVTSRKTKRHRKGWRVVPLFPELHDILAEALESRT